MGTNSMEVDSKFERTVSTTLTPLEVLMAVCLVLEADEEVVEVDSAAT